MRGLQVILQWQSGDSRPATGAWIDPGAAKT